MPYPVTRHRICLLPEYKSRSPLPFGSDETRRERIIYEGERTIIVQPFIPVVAGKRAFRAEQDAQRVGNLVLERIEAGDEFAISKGDLDNLGVTY